MNTDGPVAPPPPPPLWLVIFYVYYFAIAATNLLSIEISAAFFPLKNSGMVKIFGIFEERSSIFKLVSAIKSSLTMSLSWQEKFNIGLFGLTGISIVSFQIGVLPPLRRAFVLYYYPS